jgi:hypothetical protein
VRDRHRVFSSRENPMSDDAKAILGAIILAPFLYFLLIVLMSF